MDQDLFKRVLTRAVVLPLFFLAIIAGLLLWQINRLLDAARWVEHTDQVIAQAYDAQKLLVDMETGLRGYLLTGNKVFLEPYNSATATIDNTMGDLGRLVADNAEQRQTLGEVAQIYGGWANYAREVINLRERGGDYLTPVSESQGKSKMDAMRARFSTFIKREEQLRANRTTQTRNFVWLVVGSIIFTTLLLGGVLAYFIRRQLFALAGAYGRALTTTQQQSDALRESSRRTEAILESIGDAFVAVDADWQMTYLNAQAEELFGRARGSLINKRIWDEFPALRDTDFAANLRRAAAEKKSIKFETNDPVPDRAFETSVYPAAAGLSIYFNDITERRRAEREQSRLREELINIQAARLEELSTPLIPLSREIVIMPLIGTIDAERADRVLTALGRGVAERAARVVVLDITGVSTVDTQVASALIQAAQIVRLLGAEVVLTGIRPRVAQTLVGLGVDLAELTTRSSLQSGVDYATELLRADQSFRGIPA